MNDEKISVIARFQAKRGSEHTLRSLLLKLVEPTRKEKGCINYDLHQSRQDAGLFFFYENWTDQASLDRHLESLHVKEMLKDVPALIAAPIELHLLNQI